MACVVAPAIAAVMTSVWEKRLAKKEAALAAGGQEASAGRIPFSRKVGWLSKMLWGGSFLLAIEHIWHGEITLWPPFLTAMENPEDTAAMLKEIAGAGTSMTLLVGLVWGGMLLAARTLENRSLAAAPLSEK